MTTIDFTLIPFGVAVPVDCHKSNFRGNRYKKSTIVLYETLQNN